MMAKPLLWLSIAATDAGTDGDFSQSIPTEIAAILTNDRIEPIDGTYDRILLTPAHAKALKAHPKAVTMLKADKALHVNHPEATTLADAERTIIELLDEAKVEDPLPIAGRAAQHFLLPVVRAHMPDLAERVTDWTLDASQLVRWAGVVNGLGRLRSHIPDLIEYEPLLEAMPQYSERTFREVLTASMQFKNALEGS